MKLYYSSTSPFVRKVNVLAMETGLDKKIEWLKTNPWQAEEKLIAENPLSKIPTLVTDDDEVIFDSAVICEYLDNLHNNEKLIPAENNARWQVLRIQALADGILDAGILRFLEKKRVAEKQSAEWDEIQKDSIERGLDYLEDKISSWSCNKNLDLGVISVACALGWLDFRFANENWRSNHPQLSAWYANFSNRPSMLETLPKE